MKKLYFHASNYNMARLGNALAVLVAADGGEIIRSRYQEEKEIHPNMCVYDIQKELFHVQNLISENKHPEHLEKFQRIADRKTEELEQAKKEQEEKSVLSWVASDWGGMALSWVNGGLYYHISLNDNPFMEHWFIKAETDGKKYPVTVGGELEHGFLFDDLWKFSCSDETIKEMATALYNQVTEAATMKPYRETNRRRVRNTYNNGYHYEVIQNPIEYKTIERIS